jgi:N-glycosylase/DNA lyase
MIFCQILAADEENVFVIRNFFVLIAWHAKHSVQSWKARKPWEFYSIPIPMFMNRIHNLSFKQTKKNPDTYWLYDDN